MRRPDFAAPARFRAGGGTRLVTVVSAERLKQIIHTDAGNRYNESNRRMGGLIGIDLGERGYST